MHSFFLWNDTGEKKTLLNVRGFLSMTRRARGHVFFLSRRLEASVLCVVTILSLGLLHLILGGERTVRAQCARGTVLRRLPRPPLTLSLCFLCSHTHGFPFSSSRVLWGAGGRC